MKNFIDNSFNKYNIDDINRLALECPEKLVEMSENNYRTQIANIAEEISDNKHTRVIMLAGPSGSGKTTSAKILINELKRRGRDAVFISLDDFYLPGDQAPIGEDGKRDYETVHALDIDLVRVCISSLIKTGEFDVPQYEFGTSARLAETQKVVLKSGAIAIIEGLHALNPLFTAGMDPESLIKIYINPGADIMKDGEYLLTCRDFRFMRRLIRDFQFRMASAELTLSMWESVVEAESQYIDPFKFDRDYYVRTLHPYEPCVIGAEARELLLKVDPENENYYIVKDILERIKDFVTIEESLVPENSLLREFLGEGKYDN